MKTALPLLAMTLIPVLQAQAQNTSVSLRVPDLQTPLRVDDVRDIGGFVGTRLRANSQGSLKGFDIDRYTRMVETKSGRDWFWIGEQPGKWLESAVWSSQESGDKDLSQRAHAILTRLEASQEKDGYLGITADDLRTADQPLRGMDPYELYFMLHGLLTAHDEWNDASALQTAKRLGDYFVNTIGPTKAQFWPSDLHAPENKGKVLTGHSKIAGHSVHYGMEGTLLIDPMLRLYEETGDKKYLTWCQWVVSNIDTWSGWNTFSNLDKVADGTMGIDQVQPYVHSHTFQMNFLGFLRLYQITGDASLLRKVEGAWNDVAKRQMYITGGVSVGEHYEKGYNRPITGNVVETCATMSWLQLTQALLDLTGDPKYADAMEKLLVNHVFASQTVDGDSYRYHTPPNGFKPAEFFHGPDCCTSSGHRLASMLPQFFYGQGKGGIYVNQFVPSTGEFTLNDGTAVSIQQKTSYPESEAVELVVSPTKAAHFVLNVRIPGWCAKPVLKVDGKQLEVKAGSYARLERTWKAGERVSLALPMEVKWNEHDHYGPDAPWALTRGPVVYVLDTVWWNDKRVPMPENIGEEASIFPGVKPVVVPAPTGATGPALEVPIKLSDGAETKARMVPFTNLGQWYRPGEAKPDRNSSAFSYAIYLLKDGDPAFERFAAQRHAQAEIERNSFDFLKVGDPDSEKAHNFVGENSHSGLAGGRRWRDAANGSVSYVVKVSPQVPSDLVVTYWGGDNGNRVFDILINGQKIAEQTLQNNKPGEFFEVRTPIPFNLIDGKTDDMGRKVESVTLKFQSHPGATVGGIFGLRIEPHQ